MVILKDASGSMTCVDCRPESEEPRGLPSALPLLGFLGFSTGRLVGSPQGGQGRASRRRVVRRLCSRPVILQSRAWALSRTPPPPPTSEKEDTACPAGAPASRAARGFPLWGARIPSGGAVTSPYVRGPAHFAKHKSSGFSCCRISLRLSDIAPWVSPQFLCS